MQDSFGREINYLRVSVTERCNLKCNYCQPYGLKRNSLSTNLSFEQIVQICKAASELGITKFKITGGEPLVREGICALIKMIKSLPNVEQVTLTTNGILLKKFVPELKKIGINGINVSLDTLDPCLFRQISGVDGLSSVLESIEYCLEAGIKTKLNCVLQKGINENSWIDLLNFVKDKNLDIRFIEVMPIGWGKISNGVSNKILLEKICNEFGSFTIDRTVHGNGPAFYIKLEKFVPSIGFISAISNKFCQSCNRLRLTSTGQLKPCLCFGGTVNLLPCFQKKNQAQVCSSLKNLILESCRLKPEKNQFEKSELVTEKKLMAQIGG